MLRLAASFAAVFMLLLGPALCMGGLLEHECDCGKSDVEAQCQHEDACSEDPCLTTASAPGQGTVADLALAACRVARTLPPWASDAVATGPHPPRPALPPDRWNLPYAQSDRPRLL